MLHEEVAVVAHKVLVEEGEPPAVVDLLRQAVGLAGVEALVTEVDLDVAPAGGHGHERGHHTDQHDGDSGDGQGLAGVALALGDRH